MSSRMIATAVCGAAVLLGLSIARAPRPEAAQLASAAALHRDAIVVEGHAHTINRVFHEGIDPWKPQPTGLWDYARARQGGVDVVIENVHADDAYNNYNATVKQVVRLIEVFYRVLDANRDKMELALTSADVRRIVADGKMAVVLAIESGFDMEGDLDVLRLFHRLGVRLVQFANHNTTNAYVDAGLGERRWNGINQHGRKLIEEMNRLGIIIDVSHASDEAQLQIIAASRAPVTGSHHGLRAFSDHPRNMSDAVLKQMAAKSGLLGMHSSAAFLSQKYYDWSRSRSGGTRSVPLPIRSPDRDYGSYIAALDALVAERWIQNYAKPWRELAPPDAPLPTVSDWADQVDYVVQQVGDSHVAIGLDMNQGGSNLQGFDATAYPKLTEALMAKGYTTETIRRILGENWLRLLDAALVPGASTAARAGGR
jgi:membrane dipeptidase